MAGDPRETASVPPPMIGSYRLVEPLGSGGMSSVFRALHKDTGHEVAVKVLPRYLAKNATLLQRFLREAKSAESLEDPNIVAIYDRGSEAGRYYLVLEYVPGGDLHDLVRERGPMPIVEAVDAIRQVARGLKHAVGRGLIHRDIKPANILRTPDGRVKVTDLGLALQMEDEDERVTRDGTTVGTVDYMAPEQARDSRATSARSDMYSLGCTFYYLLTGAPPFRGGDVAEKLRAHATEPAPDARQIRPEVPQVLAHLIRKMMAKKPDKRFPDYDNLLDTLDAVTAILDRPAQPPAVPAPLLALIDDEDDDDVATVDAPLQALIDDEDDAPKPAPLMALLDEDDGPDFTLGAGFIKGGSTASSPVMPAPLLDLSALSALVEGDPTSRKTPFGSTASTSGSATRSGSGPRLLSNPLPRSGSGPIAPPPDAPPADELYDLSPPISTTPHLYQQPPPSAPVDVTGWLIKAVLAIVVGLVALFAWNRLSPFGTPEKVAEYDLPPNLATNDSNSGASLHGSTRWIEPADAIASSPAASPVPVDTLAALGMTGVADEAPIGVENPTTVRRVAGRQSSVGLRDALDKLSGTVLLQDNGPMEIRDLRIAGKSRSLKAAEGYRPVIVLGAGGPSSVKTRPAAIVLSGQSLVVEGIDFVIPGGALTPRQQAFFLLDGGELTLRECTITVVGPIGHAYAVVQVGERGDPAAKASRVRIERTLIRGDASPLRLAGPAEVAVARSALIAGKGPVVEIAGGAENKRSLAIFRSILAGRGSAVDLSGSAGAPGAIAPEFRVQGGTFASIGDGPPSPFVELDQVPAGPARTTPLLAWRGDENLFQGWVRFASARPVGVLEGLRASASETDSASREVATRWPATAADTWASEAVPRDLANGLAASAEVVPSPPPSLRERTVGAFPPTGVKAPTRLAPSRELAFDASSPEWKGDLGRFLAAAKPRPGESLRVVASGEGTHVMSPVALPEGASLEVVARPDPRGRPLIWAASDAVTEPALISARRGSIRLERVRLAATPRARIRHLVAVDQGDLSLSRCVLTGPDDVGPDAGLVLFRTDGTRSYPDSSPGTPTCALADCVLIGGGAVVTAEVGRGAVSLTNCAIAASSVALLLKPEAVRRDRFMADLSMTRCTIAAERDFVVVNSWTGLPPGPDRPWVVRTEACAFLDAYRRGRVPPRAVVLRSQENALTRGVLAWQSSGDIYDLAHFAMGEAATPPPSARFDIDHDWIELWGSAHVVNPRGPKAARLLVDRLSPGSVAPGDLAMDPTFHPGRPGLDAGADLGAMGISPTTLNFRQEDEP